MDEAKAISDAEEIPAGDVSGSQEEQKESETLDLKSDIDTVENKEDEKENQDQIEDIEHSTEPSDIDASLDQGEQIPAVSTEEESERLGDEEDSIPIEKTEADIPVLQDVQEEERTSEDPIQNIEHEREDLPPDEIEATDGVPVDTIETLDLKTDIQPADSPGKDNPVFEEEKVVSPVANENKDQLPIVEHQDNLGFEPELNEETADHETKEMPDDDEEQEKIPEESNMVQKDGNQKKEESLPKDQKDVGYDETDNVGVAGYYLAQNVDSSIVPETTPLLAADPQEDQPNTSKSPLGIPIPNGTPEVEVLPVAQSPTRVYKLRFYILLMFSLLGFTQNMGWNTWGPLSKSAEQVFHWKDADIALLANWGPIAYIVSIVFFSWLMDVKGIRWSCVVTAGLLLVGFGFRCITPHLPAVTWLIHVGQAFIGLAGPITMGGPPLVSAVWFPVHERTTATAFAIFISVMGLAVSFIIGPQYVPVPMCNNCSSVAINSSDCVTVACPDNTTNYNITNTDQMTTKIMQLMYIEFGWAAFLFLLVLLYLPARPALPPSITATQERTSFKKGLLDLLRHKKFWLLGIPYALSTGVYNCWGSVLAVNLNPLHKVISPDEAGWIGFYGTIAGGITSVVVARFADIFARRMRLFLLVLYAGAVVSFAWFAVVCQQVINLSSILILVSLYGSMILGSMFINGGVPLFYELVCESCYPIAEGVTNGFLTWLNNVAGLIFLLIMMLRPYIGTVWMNWFLVGCILACMPILFIFEERYQRLEIDTEDEDKPSQVVVN